MRRREGRWLTRNVGRDWAKRESGMGCTKRKRMQLVSILRLGLTKREKEKGILMGALECVGEGKWVGCGGGGM